MGLPCASRGLMAKAAVAPAVAATDPGPVRKQAEAAMAPGETRRRKGLPATWALASDSSTWK